jgi:hypothetical protein
MKTIFGLALVLGLFMGNAAKASCDAADFNDPAVLAKIAPLPALIAASLEKMPLLVSQQVLVTSIPTTIITPSDPAIAVGYITLGSFTLSNGVSVTLSRNSGNHDDVLLYLNSVLTETSYDEFGRVVAAPHCQVVITPESLIDPYMDSSFYKVYNASTLAKIGDLSADTDLINQLNALTGRIDLAHN